MHCIITTIREIRGARAPRRARGAARGGESWQRRREKLSGLGRPASAPPPRLESAHNVCFMFPLPSLCTYQTSSLPWILHFLVPGLSHTTCYPARQFNPSKPRKKLRRPWESYCYMDTVKLCFFFFFFLLLKRSHIQKKAKYHDVHSINIVTGL